MGLSNYIEKALDIVMQEETEKWINKLEASKNKAQLAYIYGYEKGCKDKDLEQEEAIAMLDKIDTKAVIKTIENMSHLVEFLKKDNNALVKSKLIQDIIELNEYINESVTNGNN